MVIHVGTRIYTSMHRTCLLACCTCWTKDSPKSQTQSSMRIYDHQMTQSVKLLQKKSICRRHTLSPGAGSDMTTAMCSTAQQSLLSILHMCNTDTAPCHALGPRAGGPNGNAPLSHPILHIGRSSPARAASLRRRSMDDEAEISSGTDTDEDGALIEKARQAAEQKRAPPRKRGPTSGSHCCAFQSLLCEHQATWSCDHCPCASQSACHALSSC